MLTPVRCCCFLPPSQKGHVQEVFCLRTFQIIPYTHIYMLLSVYGREGKIIEMDLYKVAKFYFEDPCCLGFALEMILGQS